MSPNRICRLFHREWIPEEFDRCGICYSSLTSLDPNEYCEGYGARKLSCGHIFGRKCLLSTFEIGQEGGGPPKSRCPTCQMQFLIALNSKVERLPFVAASLSHYLNVAFPSFLFLEIFLMGAIFPYILGVGMSMELAAKVNVRRRHWLPTTPRWIRLLSAAFGVASWILATYWLSYKLYDPLTGWILYCCQFMSFFIAMNMVSFCIFGGYFLAIFR